MKETTGRLQQVSFLDPEGEEEEEEEEEEVMWWWYIVVVEANTVEENEVEEGVE